MKTRLRKAANLDLESKERHVCENNSNNATNRTNNDINTGDDSRKRNLVEDKSRQVSYTLANTTITHHDNSSTQCISIFSRSSWEKQASNAFLPFLKRAIIAQGAFCRQFSEWKVRTWFISIDWRFKTEFSVNTKSKVILNQLSTKKEENWSPNVYLISRPFQMETETKGLGQS